MISLTTLFLRLVLPTAAKRLREWRENKQIRLSQVFHGKGEFAGSMPPTKTQEEAGQLSAVTHRLGLRVETISNALWKWSILKYGPIKSYVEGETYNIAFKFRNLGSHDYPGGNARIMIKWPSGIFVVWAVTIPKAP